MKTIELPPGYSTEARGTGLHITNEGRLQIVLKISKKGSQINFYERVPVKKRRAKHA